MSPNQTTHFAPAERLTVDALADILTRISALEQFQWLENVPLMIYLTNPYRQIVYCNMPFKKAVRPQFQDEIIGMRPGEALGCIHSREMQAGCGCALACRHCGAAMAILKSLQGIESCKECHIDVQDGEYVGKLDIQVLSRPFTFENQTFSLNTAFDISHERVLFEQNRSFLHSMINAAGGMESLLGMLHEDRASEQTAHLSTLHYCALSMLQEVLYQYDSLAAETGKLAVNPRRFEIATVVTALAEQFAHNAHGKGRSILMSGTNGHVDSDPRLVRHVLFNLLLNALEGSTKADAVAVDWRRIGERMHLQIENPGTIAPEIRKQLFIQPVSTKGTHRGLGLYMARKIVEDSLKGELLCEELPGKVRFSVILPDLQVG